MRDHLQPVYTTDREGRIRSGSTQIDLGSAFTLRRPSALCTCDSGSKFMISHMPRPHSHETIDMFGNSIYNTMTTPRLETGPFVIWFGYYWQPSRPRSTPYQRVRFRLHLRRERSGSNQFDGVWWSSTERIGAVRFGSVRVYITR